MSLGLKFFGSAKKTKTAGVNSEDFLTLIKRDPYNFAELEHQINRKPVDEIFREIELGLRFEQIDFSSVYNKTIVLVPPKYEFWVYVLISLFLAMSGNKVVFLYYKWSNPIIDVIKKNLNYLKYQNLVFQDLENENIFWPEDSLVLNFSEAYQSHTRIPSFSTSIVTKSADLDYLMGYILSNTFSFTGMKASNLKRVIVDQSLRAEFEEKLNTRLESMEQVNRTQIKSKKLRNSLHTIISEAISDGGELLIGKPDLDSDFYENIVLNEVTKDMRIYQKKFFGPVLLVTYSDFSKESLIDHIKQQPSKGVLIFSRDEENLHEEISTELPKKHLFVARPLREYMRYNVLLENNPAIEYMFKKLEIK